MNGMRSEYLCEHLWSNLDPVAGAPNTPVQGLWLHERVCTMCGVHMSRWSTGRELYDEWIVVQRELERAYAAPPHPTRNT